MCIRDRDNRFKSISVIPFTALLDQHDGGSHSKVSNFIVSRKPETTNIHVMVSKKGREDVYNTPEELIIEIGRALDKKDIVLPEPFRKERKRCLEIRVKKMNTSEGKG